MTALDLRGNKWEELIDSSSLRLYMIGQLKLLQSINGLEVTGEEAELALRAVVSSQLSMATVVSKVRTNPSAPPSLSLLTTAEQLVSNSKCVGGPSLVYCSLMAACNIREEEGVSLSLYRELPECPECCCHCTGNSLNVLSVVVTVLGAP